MTARRRGFTLVELLVVITIIAILIALLFPIIGAAINSSKETVCKNNMGQLAKVIMVYADDNDGRFPFVGLPGAAGVSWRPSANDWLYVGNVPSQANVDSGVLYRNKKVGTRNVFYCPVDIDNGLVRPSGALMARLGTVAAGRPICSYPINGSITWGDFFSSSPPATMPLVFKDGQRHVRKIADFDPNDFMFIEESDDSTWNGAWFPPASATYHLTDRHRGGGHVACMDGHVEWMTPTDFKTEEDKTLVGGNVSYTVTGTRWNPN